MIELPDYMLPEAPSGSVEPRAQQSLVETGIGPTYTMGCENRVESYRFHICGKDNFKAWVDFWSNDLDRGTRMLLWTIPTTDVKQRIRIPSYTYESTTKYLDRWVISADVIFINA